jgi:glycosyltransferase involved in cell wall biosynthesis
VIVLIPAYEPDEHLVDLVAGIRTDDPDQRVLVVDDGSGIAHASVFAAVRAQGAEVIAHRTNRGKGAALRTGFAWIVEHHHGHDVVCADCDGQHVPADIRRVGAAVAEHPGSVVLGARSFGGEVPWRCRFGNDVTKRLFGLVTGTRLGDTQTGLRGYSADLLAWLATVAGDHFEYELEVLLDATRRAVPIVEVPIRTIYLEHNRSSHFRPVRDSVRVYVPLLRFALRR